MTECSFLSEPGELLLKEVTLGYGESCIFVSGVSR